MNYIRPQRRAKVTWEISERTRALIEAYSLYTELKQNEIVDRYMEEILLSDNEFIKWLTKKRFNKRLIAKIFPDRNDDEFEQNTIAIFETAEQ